MGKTMNMNWWENTPRYQPIQGLLQAPYSGSPVEVYQRTKDRLNGLLDPYQSEQRAIEKQAEEAAIDPLVAQAQQDGGSGLWGGGHSGLLDAPPVMGDVPRSRAEIEAMKMGSKAAGLLGPVGMLAQAAHVGLLNREGLTVPQAIKYQMGLTPFDVALRTSHGLGNDNLTAEGEALFSDDAGWDSGFGDFSSGFEGGFGIGDAVGGGWGEAGGFGFGDDEGWA